MKKALIIAASALVLAGVLVFAVAFEVAGFDITKLGTSETETNTYKPKGDFKKIEINTSLTDTKINVDKGGELSVVCTERSKIKHSVSVEDGVLKICVLDTAEWYDYLSLFAPSMKAEINLPSDYYESLKAETGTGELSAPSGLRFGEAEIVTSTGDVEFDSEVKGNLSVKTSTGDIKIGGQKAESVSLSSSTGKLTVGSYDIAKNLSLSSGTGKTELTDVACGSLDAKSTTGSIKLKNVTASGKFDISATTGSIKFDSCDAEEITVSAKTGSVKGTLRTAKRFTARSTTGSVRVPDTYDGGRCEITTVTGSIEIEIEKAGS